MQEAIIIKNENIAVRLYDDNILAYDLLQDIEEVNIYSEGILKEVSSILAIKIEDVLKINSVQNYGIKIIEAA